MPPIDFSVLLFFSKMQSTCIYDSVFNMNDKKNNLLSWHSIYFTQMDCFLTFLMLLYYIQKYIYGCLLATRS